jgi:alanyl-tRNA synthetase
MQQHTGQHLLSAVFEHELKNDTVGWMLSQNDQPSYIDLQSSPSPSDVAYVTKRCNEIIQSGRRVKVEVRLEADHERPGTMPEDYRDGVIRYVSIEDLDINPCCGTHYPSLSFLGSLFIFPGVEKISGPPRYRIYFAVGNAVLNHLANFHAVAKDVAALLDCGPGSAVERLDIALKAKKEGLRREKVLRGEACRALAMELEKGMWEVEGVRVGMLHREEESTDIELLGDVVRALTPSDGRWLVCLSSGPFVAALGTGGCLLLAGSDDALVKTAGDLIKTKFAGRVKGGGKGRWQGKLSGNWVKGDVEIFRSILESCKV